MKTKNSNLQKIDRKKVERNRRIHMKALCFKLSSLVPSNFVTHSKKVLSQQDQLDRAASYIEKQKARIEKLKKLKEQLAIMKLTRSSDNNNVGVHEGSGIKRRMAVVELRDMETSVEVILICGAQKKFMLHQVISIVEEEGGDVVSLHLSTIGDQIFHIIYAQAKISRVGVEISRVSERLKQLVWWS